MSINPLGNQPPIQGAVNIDQSQEAKAIVKETANGMNEVMTNIKELSQELRNQSAQKLTGKEVNSKLETQSNKVLEQMQQQSEVQQKQVQGQEKSQQAQMGRGGDAEVVAEAMAGLSLEEELGDKDEIQQKLEDKMKILMKKAEELQDVELDNSENNFELQEMFKNVDKFNGLKRREGQLNKQLEDLEINLKQQEAREELNKLPVDETTKKVREQLRINYEHQEQSQSQDNQDEADSESNDSDEEDIEDGKKEN
ncbi:MAG: hypothetical protein VW397_02305 [Candidatus Margulisiibacteriota bacterium]